MLRTTLLHPEILSALGRLGHGSKVLIADGNFPFTTGANPAATFVFLNLRPGLLNVTDVLETLITAIPVEAVHVMEPHDGSTPDIFHEFGALLSDHKLQRVERFAFYDLACTRDVGLVIATGEARVYANIMLTIGVVK
ncbi:MAG: RbsD or FucU transport [Chloroflexi bacterium]|nr:MAG: RbsD or FucU transport [Chloroflexota bacterium]